MLPAYVIQKMFIIKLKDEQMNESVVNDNTIKWHYTIILVY